MRSLFLPVLAVAAAFILGGCYDYREPNDIAYIVAVGIDKGHKNTEYEFTLQFARPAEISGGASEEGGKGGNTLDTLTIEAPSVYSAVNVANHVISKTFTLSHTKVIVVSKECAEEGIAELTDVFGRAADIRPGVYMCVAEGGAEEFLECVKPSIEINPVKYYRLIFENANSSYISKQNIKEVYFNLRSGTKQLAVPLVGVGKGTENKEDNTKAARDSKNIPINREGFDYGMKEYTAGELDVEKENKSEVMGTAVFYKDKMIGVMNSLESEIYNIITGTYKNGYSTVYLTEDKSTPVTLRFEPSKKPRYDIKIGEENAKIKVKIDLEAGFVSVPAKHFEENRIKEFEQRVSEYARQGVTELVEKSKNEYNSDIFGFGNYAKKCFWDNKSFEEYDWDNKYKNAEISCEVRVRIRRSGLILRDESEPKY